LELIPQFELGRYLKQLDKTYEHPLYRVDFLLIFREKGKPDRKFILEYDGFLEHFADLPGINKSNYDSYYSEEHVYRQKVLEGYGYRFLRLNRFNVGDNPVETLNERLLELIGKETKQNRSIKSIHSAIEGLQNGELKECPKCKQLRPVSDFQNKTLASGVSRFCVACKSKTASPHGARKIVIPRTAIQPDVKPCHRCGSRMLMRSGRYGKFLGCSKYPYCKATLKA
jgi:ssDNA-binding Zn-finger/Zn-ribbon topoisomerase 1